MHIVPHPLSHVRHFQGELLPAGLPFDSEFTMPALAAVMGKPEEVKGSRLSLFFSCSVCGGKTLRTQRRRHGE